MTTQYRKVQPLAPQADYRANQTVDFLLSFQDEAIVPSSLFLEFDFEALDLTNDPINPAHLDGAADIKYDNFTGAHGLIREITTTSRNLGVIENLNNYPRSVKHRRVATNNKEELGTVSSNSIEMCLPTAKITRALLAGDADDRKVPVALYLQNCLNFASGPINYDKLGETRIRLTLAPDGDFFWGTAVTANIIYKLTNLRLNYRTVKAVPEGPVVMQIMTANRDVLSTSQQAVETLVPILCDAVSCSVIRTADEQDITSNSLALQAPPSIPLPGYAGSQTYYGFNRVQYAVNSSETALYSYPLESREEIVYNGLRVFQNGMGNHSCTQEHWTYDNNTQGSESDNNTDCYLFGAPFGQAMDFRSQKFATELHSQIDSGTSGDYAIYQFFRGAMSI